MTYYLVQLVYDVYQAFNKEKGRDEAYSEDFYKEILISPLADIQECDKLGKYDNKYYVQKNECMLSFKLPITK